MWINDVKMDLMENKTCGTNRMGIGREGKLGHSAEEEEEEVIF